LETELPAGGARSRGGPWDKKKKKKIKKKKKKNKKRDLEFPAPPILT